MDKKKKESLKEVLNIMDNKENHNYKSKEKVNIKINHSEEEKINEREFKNLIDKW